MPSASIAISPRPSTDPGQLDALASLAADTQQNPRAVLARRQDRPAARFPARPHAYPLAAIPDFAPVGDDVEPAMVYAIARQESAFNPKAVSSAGARGLMQLMPATAKRTAQRFGMGFDLNRLVEDQSYNAKIGSAHLGELMEDWKGSHILAFASYNAGGGNVKKWIDAYGDPRKPALTRRLDRTHPILRNPQLRPARDGKLHRLSGTVDPQAACDRRQYRIDARCHGGCGAGRINSRFFEIQDSS